jgi:hypothetical protein
MAITYPYMVYDRNGNAFTRSEVSTIFTKPYITDVLTDAQIMFIAQQLPSPKATTGRPAYSNQELLPGIFCVCPRFAGGSGLRRLRRRQCISDLQRDTEHS